MKKRTLVILLCFALTLSLLNACAGQGGTGTASATAAATTTVTATTKASVTTTAGSATTMATTGTTTASGAFEYNGMAPVCADLTTLSLMTSNGASLYYDYTTMSWFHEIMKRANIELDLEMIDSTSYGDVFKTRMAAGVNLADIIRLSASDSELVYADSGLFIDYSDLYDQYGYNMKVQYEEANPTVKGQITTADGKMFYVHDVNLTVDNCRCVMVNRPWLEQLGLSDPTNVDELYSVLTAIKENDCNGNGDATDEIPLFMRSNMTQLWGNTWGLDLVTGYRADLKGVMTCSYTQDAYYDFLVYFNKLYKDGLLYNEFPTANYDTQTALYANNQIGMIYHFISNCTSYSKAINPDWIFNADEPIMQVINPIVGPYGNQENYGRDAVGGSAGISRDCVDPVTAFCFLDYLFSTEASELYWYGIEGVDYENVNGEYQFSDQYLNDPEYRTKMGYNCSMLPLVQIAGSYATTECKQNIEYTATARNFAVNPTVLFTYALPEESETLSTYKADLSTYFGEMFTGFITGSTPLSDFDKYVENVEAMHINDVIAVYQAQYDRIYSK